MRPYRFLPDRAATQDTLQVVRGHTSSGEGPKGLRLWVPISQTLSVYQSPWEGRRPGKPSGSLAGDLTCWLQLGLGEGGRR